MGAGTESPFAPIEAIQSLRTVTESYHDTLLFYLNGTKVELDSIDPDITLLEYLRGIGLTGTKLGCAEGGCGACTVVVSQFNPTTKRLYHASVNACLAPLISVDGKHVITVEGIGNVDKPHPVQERIAKGNGSQCGYCTPGIVMSLYALLRNNPRPSEQEVEEAFDGNLCRCTGYRPILDAAQSFSSNGKCALSGNKGGDACCMTNGDGVAPNGCCRGEGIGNRSSVAKFKTPEFIEYNPDTQLIFPPKLINHSWMPLALGNKTKRWYRPVTLTQLLEIKNVCPSAKIIGGSTETQIETKFKAVHYPVSVFVGDIAELRSYNFGNDHVEIGANMTLTDLELIAGEAIERYGSERSQAFRAMLKQLGYFAGRQIRNVGTPAGNLATASPISDLNPILVASDAILLVRSLHKREELPMSGFFRGYRTTALPQDAVIFAIRIPLLRDQGDHLRAYKHAKRKDDDIAIVNAAMKVSLNASNIVISARIVYGGMAATTIVAKRATDFLIGRDWADPKTLEGALNALEHDFDLHFDVPGGMATYRKTLAFGFFYRFYHDVLADLNLDRVNADRDVIHEIRRDISTGETDQTATDGYQQRILGKAKPHISALKQCTGEAQYTDDMPAQKNELHGCLVLSTKPHAKLLSVDCSLAMDLPGVVEWVDHTDLPNPEANWWGAPSCDEVFFAVDEVFTAGQPIGMILADTAQHAAAGSRAVKVEYEALPAIFTIDEAIEKESFFEHKRYIKKGDTEAAFRLADHVFEGQVRIGGQEHFYLETNVCLIIPKPEDGEMEVWSSTQNPTETQSYVAKVTNVAANKIVTRVKRLGGGFGGKETRSIQLAAICAVAAKKTRRPVRCMLNRDEDMMTSGQRHPFLARWRVAMNKDYKLQALDTEIFANAGWSQDLSGAVCDRALSHIDNCYYIPNVHVRGRLAKTNTMSNTAFRGFGGPQGMFIAETYMSEIADHLSIPVETLREANFYVPNQETHFNQSLKDWHIPLLWSQLRSEVDYPAQVAAVQTFNRTHRWKKRGLSMIPTKFGISFTALFLNQAGALVHIYHDGSVLLAHGGTEMGQGLHTKMSMLAAEALNVALSDIHISETATNTVANTSSTAASASSDLNGYAIINACTQLNERLAPYRVRLGPTASMSDLASAAYFDRVNLTANGFYRTPDLGYEWGSNTGQMFYYFTQGVTLAVVEVDSLTGDWTCLRADIKMDIGRSLNPAIDYGQILGAFTQGLGLFTMEEPLLLRSTGQLWTRGPGTYKIPGFRDVPQFVNISMLKGVEWEELRTVERSRGVGEPPLFMASSVFFAIREAVKARMEDLSSAEGEQPDGFGVEGPSKKQVVHMDSPATGERIRLACQDDLLKRAMVRPQEGRESFFVAT